MNACSPVINGSLNFSSNVSIPARLEAVNAVAGVVNSVALVHFNSAQQESYAVTNALFFVSVIVIGALGFKVPYFTEQCILFFNELGHE